MIFIKKFLQVFKNFLLIGSYLVYSLLAIIPMLLLGLKAENLTDKEKHLLTVFASIVYMIIIIIIYRKSLKKEFERFKKEPKLLMERNFKYYLIGIIVMMFSNIFISIMIKTTAQNEQIVQEELLKAPLYMIYSACLFAPFVEEILFRKTLRNIFPTNIVFIMMSGLLFGYIHTLANFTSITELLYIIPYGAVGSMFALMYVKEENIFVPIAFHAFHNTMLIVISLLIH